MDQVVSDMKHLFGEDALVCSLGKLLTMDEYEALRREQSRQSKPHQIDAVRPAVVEEKQPDA